MKQVYEALEDAEASVIASTTIEDINAAVQASSEPVFEVSRHYGAAGTAMGAAGKASLRLADLLEKASITLESWEAQPSDPDALLRIEKEEWAAMLRERGLDPGDYAINNAISRHRAFVAQELDESELEARIEQRALDENVNPVVEAKEQALELLKSLVD